MVIQVVDSRTGKELLRESDWKEEPPRVGDIIELRCGEMERYLVEEVDWVFEKSSPDKREEVPLKTLRVLVQPAPESGHSVSQAEEAVVSHREEHVCRCGHKRDVHTPTRCMGDAGRCECKEYQQPYGKA